MTLGSDPAKKAAEEDLKRKARGGRAVESRRRCEAQSRGRGEEICRRGSQAEGQARRAGEGAAESSRSGGLAPAATPPRRSLARRRCPAIDPGDLARLLQYPSRSASAAIRASRTANGPNQSIHAMQEFNKHAKGSFDVKVASLGALDAVRQQKDRICPLVCGRARRSRAIAAWPTPASAASFATRLASASANRQSGRRPSGAKEDAGGGGAAGGGRRLLRSVWAA